MDNTRHGDGGWAPLVVVLMAATGAVIGAVAVTLKVADGSHPMSDTVLTGLSGSLFLLAGLVAHLRRPADRTGLLMMVVGLAFFAEDIQFSTDPAVFTAGLVFAHASTPAIVHLVLAFPQGRLPNRAARIVTVVTYVVVYSYALVSTLFSDWEDIGRPRNLLMISDGDQVMRYLHSALDVIGIVLATVIVLMLAQRFRTAPPHHRAALAPVLVVGLIGGIASLAGSAVGSTHALYPVLSPIYRVAFFAWPLAFLVGALWTRPRRAVIADLLIAARRPDSLEGLRHTLAVALRDPSLQLGRWEPGAQDFVDTNGQPVGAGTVLDDRDGRPLGALSRREVPWEDARTAEAVAALAALVLDNQRLTAEVSARLAEVRASRARLVTAADDERRRVERDLHDGAQQRLVVVALGIQLALDQAKDPELVSLLTDTAAGISAAINELRELAQGIHPALLAEAGLVPAVAELAERAPLPVELHADGLPRLPTTVEATAYFVIAEAMTNALKHAQATGIEVRMALRDNTLHVEVRDDGIGGAQVTDGSGLAGLRDRVRALDGELTVHDKGHDKGGTTVTAEIPRG